MKPDRILVTLLLLAAGLYSCHSGRVFEQNQSTGKAWSWGDPRSFEVDIPDTSSRYDVYVNIRHQRSYAYANCWLLIRTITPSNDTLRSRMEIGLSDAEGNWLGACQTGLCLRRELIGSRQVFAERGRYRFELEQDMRENPLTGIQDVGIRLEKVGVSNDL